MVKVSFNAALAQKDVKKDFETLIPAENRDTEAALVVRQRSRAWCWCVCLGIALFLSGVVVAGAYLYRYYVVEGHRNLISSSHWADPQQDNEVFICGVNYHENDYMITEEEEMMEEQSFRQRLLQERIQVLVPDQVEIIHVPVPDFEDGDPADIVHDFQRRLTAYLDLSLDKCYVIPLNTSVVMPPTDLLDLLINVKAGTYLPQSYLVHEEMVVTERLENIENLGAFIYTLCRGKDTYKLQRRDRILGMQKREALTCHKIRHFENTFVVETLICEP
ncbi:integral membrane protein 2B isoform X2 [Nothobranchius furzeri]|uniref:integral membrane protein 2B isoform X2 n=1 Tax=Nothobranchius furzeri TaxID=105023 RepID=UPI0024043E90|nr:integral membrane protein 2Bb isoform X2 [Nothobranchius furzeri]